MTPRWGGSFLRGSKITLSLIPMRRSQHMRCLKPSEIYIRVTVMPGSLLSRRSWVFRWAKESSSSHIFQSSQLWDELGGVGMTITDSDFVTLVLLGLQKSWENFQDAISGKGNIPSWERLWNDCIKKRSREAWELKDQLWKGTRRTLPWQAKVGMPRARRA